MKRLALLILVTALFLAGCADTHQLTRMQGVEATPTQGATAYIALPKDGYYGATQYIGSGMLVAHEVGSAFSTYLKETVTGSSYEDMNAAIDSAKHGNYDYLIYPVILHWEDRATEWSGRPDIASVKVSIVDLTTGKTVDSAVIGGKSKIMSWGGDRPEDLLAEPLANYAAEIFHQVSN